ncbi:ABC transporter ATP-binding protein [Neorhizobium lilium]|uniref:ABC transporter ATP-binding protein n=1 Tax=Neorhizobium lilium TaxID=2503024 RepID=A0A3S3S9W1_9HYPH|nr:ABC transporter ATP-binding protein [Neorhizobium lilium]RWX74974.1 ABC transporter ATP-binding protein [Neorhizobium lilium]
MAEHGLNIRNLTITAPSASGEIGIVHNLSFSVGRGIVALVGESGSGKSTTARAVLGLNPEQFRVTADRFSFDGEDLLDLSEKRWRSVRGRMIALMPQDPKTALNPSHTIGRQVEETLLLHGTSSRSDRRLQALDMLRRVGLTDAERVHASYPAQMSGGMAQRAMIAAMLVSRPKLLVADEPTSALDREAQAVVLSLLSEFSRDLGMGLLLISHDLALVSRFAERVIVMRAGRIEEELAATALDDARSTYTQSLWRARPSAETYGQRLPVMDE